MRSAIGNSLLLNLVIIIVSTIMLVFVSVLAYSKAYRIKNRIIEIIEKNGVFEKYDSSGKNLTEEEINNFLHDSGYKVGKYNKCAKILEDKGITREENIVHDGDYNYCVGKKMTADGSTYYVVITFVEFNFPIVGSISPSAVSGETKILDKDYSSYK